MNKYYIKSDVRLSEETAALIGEKISSFINGETHDGVVPILGPGLSIQSLPAQRENSYNYPVIVRCSWCGQWGAVKTQCRHCGQPVGACE